MKEPRHRPGPSRVRKRRDYFFAAATAAAKLDGDIELDLVVVLTAAEALGHDGADQAGIDIFIDRFARDVAIALGPDGALLQSRRQRPGT